MKFPLTVKIKLASSTKEFSLSRVEANNFKFTGYQYENVCLEENWKCSDESALLYFQTALQAFVSKLTEKFEIIDCEPAIISKTSFRCANGSCNALLLKGYGDIRGVEVLCKKCKKVSPPFNFK